MDDDDDDDVGVDVDGWVGWSPPWWWMRAFFPATTLSTAPLITALVIIIIWSSMIITALVIIIIMIKDNLQCNFALELFSIVVSRKSRTDCSRMFFQLRARRSASAGSQIPITTMTFYALWPTILISNVSLINIYPIFQKWMERWVCVGGEVHWISEGCFTQTIYFSIDGPGQIYSKLVAVKVGLEILKIQTKLKFKI